MFITLFILFILYYLYLYNHIVYIHILYLKLIKSAGIDEIPPEVWKSGYFNDQLLEFCNDVFSQKPIDYWTKGCILPFPKKGELSVTDNYRGITLTCIAAKIYNTMIRERIQRIHRRDS